MAVIPLVSVVMITYNHEKYIQQAVEGVLMQQCNFPVELIIADDNSPDTTEDVVKKMLINHSNSHWVKYTKHQQNKGMMPNFIWALEQCKGKYIALCEGDDYWTDPLKLQKQVDFLEENEEYSMCFHNSNHKYELGGYEIKRHIVENRNYFSDELLLKWIVPTASIVFKKWIDNSILKDKNIVNGDIILVLLCAEMGLVRGMKECMAVYRIQPKGLSISRNLNANIKLTKKYIDQFKLIKKSFGKVSRNAATLKIVDNCFTASKYYLRKNILKSMYYVAVAIYYRPEMIFRYLKKNIT